MTPNRFTTQDKLNALTLLHTGVSKKSLARLLQVDRREIVLWELRYQQYGRAGLESKTRARRIVPAEKRKQIVEEYLAGGISSRQLCVKHDICLSSLKNWLRKYRQEDSEK